MFSSCVYIRSLHIMFSKQIRIPHVVFLLLQVLPRVSFCPPFFSSSSHSTLCLTNLSLALIQTAPHQAVRTEVELVFVPSFLVLTSP